MYCVEVKRVVLKKSHRTRANSSDSRIKDSVKLEEWGRVAAEQKSIPRFLLNSTHQQRDTFYVELLLIYCISVTSTAPLILVSLIFCLLPRLESIIKGAR